MSGARTELVRRAQRGWTIALVAAVFVEAIARLGAVCARALRDGLSPLMWACFVVLTAAFVYGEGHRALARRFVPRFLSRLDECAPVVGTVTGFVTLPLRSLSFIGDRAARMLEAWAVVALIVASVACVRLLPGTWRGVIDGAVAAALSWGTGALILRLSRRTQPSRRSAVHPLVERNAARLSW